MNSFLLEFRRKSRLGLLSILLLLMLTACGGGSATDTDNGGSGAGDGNGSGGQDGNGHRPVAVAVQLPDPGTGNRWWLDASSSFDQDGAILEYRWEQVSGTPVTLPDPAAERMEIAVPVAQAMQELEFVLTVTDDDGLTDSSRLSLLVPPPAIDYSLLTGPVVIASLNRLDLSQTVRVRENHAYVADWEAGLRIVDIGNPRQPTVSATIDTRHRALDLAFSPDGDLLFVADQKGLYAIDIENPEQPFIAGQLLADDFGATALYVEGKRLYAAGYESLFVMDIGDPAEMRLLGRYPFPFGSSPTVDLVVSSGVVYLGRNNDGLRIYDARNPSDIEKLDSFDSETIPANLFLRDKRIYWGDGSHGVKIIDVSDPGLPRLLAELPMVQDRSGSHSLQAHALQVRGDLLYVSASDGYFQVWDIADQEQPVFLGAVAVERGIASFDVIGGLAYIAGVNGFSVVDVSQPRSLQSKADFIREEPEVTGTSLIVDGDKVYDVTDLSDPVVASLPLPDGYNYWSFGRLLFGIDDGYSLRPGALVIVDFTDLANPVLRGPFELPQLLRLPRNSYYHSVQYTDGRLFVSYGSGEVHFIDLSGPGSPSVQVLDLASHGYTDAKGFSGDVVYAQQHNDLVLLDVTDAANPVETGRVDYSASWVTVAGTRLYITGGFDFRIYDMSDPYGPRLLSMIPTVHLSNRIAVIGDLVFVGLGQSGSGRMMVVDVSLPEFPAYIHLQSGGKTVTRPVVNERALITLSYDVEALRVYDIAALFD